MRLTRKTRTRRSEAWAYVYTGLFGASEGDDADGTADGDGAR